jgi:hypothetical protein
VRASADRRGPGGHFSPSSFEMAASLAADRYLLSCEKLIFPLRRAASSIRRYVETRIVPRVDIINAPGPD